jgi:hypothetical protein
VGGEFFSEIDLAKIVKIKDLLTHGGAGMLKTKGLRVKILKIKDLGLGGG